MFLFRLARRGSDDPYCFLFMLFVLYTRLTRSACSPTSPVSQVMLVRMRIFRIQSIRIDEDRRSPLRTAQIRCSEVSRKPRRYASGHVCVYTPKPRLPGKRGVGLGQGRQSALWISPNVHVRLRIHPSILLGFSSFMKVDVGLTRLAMGARRLLRHFTDPTLGAPDAPCLEAAMESGGDVPSSSRRLLLQEGVADQPQRAVSNGWWSCCTCEVMCRRRGRDGRWRADDAPSKLAPSSGSSHRWMCGIRPGLDGMHGL